MAKPILHYWKGRGRAEAIRLALTAAGVEWTDAPYFTGPEQFDALKKSGKLMYNQAPLLEMDGLNLVQAQATLNYLANKYGLNGKDPKEQFKIDVIVEGLKDFYAPFMGYGFMPSETFETSAKKSIDRYMPIFEKVLTESGSGHMVGDRLTIADVRYLECVLALEELFPTELGKYPKSKDFLEKMKHVASFSKYLNGPQRFPKNDAAYCAVVGKTLGW